MRRVIPFGPLMDTPTPLDVLRMNATVNSLLRRQERTCLSVGEGMMLCTVEGEIKRLRSVSCCKSCGMESTWRVEAAIRSLFSVIIVVSCLCMAATVSNISAFCMTIASVLAVVVARVVNGA